jgi:signal transduction histidine kinase
LVISDDDVCLQIVEIHLTELGIIDVVTAKSPDEILHVVVECDPDVVLLDFQMRAGGGIEALEALRDVEDDLVNRAPVLVITDSVSDATQQRVFDLGAMDFLHKPLESIEFAVRLRNALTLAAWQQKSQGVEYQLDQQVLQRRLAEVQSQNSNEKADAAFEARTEFLAKLSHEVRTPMTAILGFTDLLLNDPVLNGKFGQQRNALLTIQRNGEFLLQIINDVLDLSKIEARKFEIRKEPCSVIELASEVTTMMRVRAEIKGISFDAECQGKLPETIVTDPGRVRQILINLIGNAIKFTESGGVRLLVRFIGDQRRTKILFEVRDTGAGMTKEQIARVFQPFSELDQPASRRFGGAGLGLTISRSIARLLGGDISVESRPEVGSKFVATIATGAIDDVKMIEATRDDGDDGQRQESKSISARILLAEDGPDNQRLIVFMLERAGADVVTANNGQVALETALQAADQGTPFDLILMDMQMPIMDGYESTRRLRAADVNTPIVALTAYALSSDREKCLDAGCDDYLSKPINRDKLLMTVDRYSQTAVEL